MPINSDGFFDWAVKDPGPDNKKWGDVNSLEAVFFHSAVGTYGGTINRVMGPDEISVTGVVDFDGKLCQFYSVTDSPWANGSHDWNKRALGIEFAGGYNGDGHWEKEPITDKQVETAVRILRDLSDFKKVPYSYWQRPSTLKEHREVYPTACPSNRIRWTDILNQLNPVVVRNFLWGDENAGMELRGNQQFHWNKGVEIDAYGDYAGDFPGEHWHNLGGKWVKVLD